MMSQKVWFISLMKDLRLPGCIIRSSASSWLVSQYITREYALRVFQRKGVSLGNICLIFGQTLGVLLSITSKNDGGPPKMGCPLLVSYLARWSFSCILQISALIIQQPEDTEIRSCPLLASPTFSCLESSLICGVASWIKGRVLQV